MHAKKIFTAGVPLETASKALILVHGRGAGAEDIVGFADYLSLDGFALLAPQAANHTWYPQSFLAPPAQNEPWLSSALGLLEQVVADIEAAGLQKRQIHFLGFSQGACLMLEFIARHGARWGGAAAFTGGLIGDKIYRENYRGSLAQTPIFIGTSDPDPHVPLERVHATTAILLEMGAMVTEKVYKHMGHTINQDEIREANERIFNPSIKA